MSTPSLPLLLKRGVLVVYNPAANFYKNRIFKASHQHHFSARTAAKWALMEPELPAEPGSLLDVGCSEGVFAREAAARGWCAWGIEAKPAAVRRAARVAAGEGRATAYFARGLVTPQAARTLPEFDVILLLSVMHQLFKRFGEAAARAMLADLLGSCRTKLFLEMAGINRKYGRAVLSRDNDGASVDELVRALVPAGWRARFLGAVPYTEEEPHRFLYVVERAG